MGETFQTNLYKCRKCGRVRGRGYFEPVPKICRECGEKNTFEYDGYVIYDDDTGKPIEKQDKDGNYLPIDQGEER